MPTLTREEVVALMQRREAQRAINPPLVIRQVCRYCNQSLGEDLTKMVGRMNGDLYAHHACYERERRR